jgi:hypothetical protein
MPKSVISRKTIETRSIFNHFPQFLHHSDRNFKFCSLIQRLCHPVVAPCHERPFSARRPADRAQDRGLRPEQGGVAGEAAGPGKGTLQGAFWGVFLIGNGPILIGNGPILIGKVCFLIRNGPILKRKVWILIRKCVFG